MDAPLTGTGWSENAAVSSDLGLVVVTNREPYVHTRAADAADAVTVSRPIGGLTAAMDAVMRDLGGTWLAWGSGDADFAVTDANDCVAVPPGEEEYTLQRVALSDDEYRDYYLGYSNQLLWPLCHQFVDRVRNGVGHWEAYQTVNERFARAASEALSRTDSRNRLLWVHDYHLALVPALVRSAVDDVPIQHFWHIPWPPASLFERCPHTRQLLDGLLGSDRIGFHIDAYARAFLETVDRHVPSARVDTDARRVEYQGRTIDVYVAPVGVDVAGIRERAESPDAAGFWQRLSRHHGIGSDERVLVGVDRLDYTKGITQRIDAFERALATDASLVGSVRLVQKGAPTRTEIPEYAQYQSAVRDRIDAVNDRFGRDEWQPVVYLDGDFSPVEVASLLRHADGCLVSPLADGYNLVAQEYVAANSADGGDRALLLSPFAGVHSLLGDDAYTVNPHDVPAFAGQLQRALSAPPEERRRRFERLSAAVAGNDISHWMSRSLSPWAERQS